MSSTILLKGKYFGSTFEEVLENDLNYCRFIVGLKFVSKDLKEFKDWLTLNIDEAIAKFVSKECKRISKQQSNV